MSACKPVHMQVVLFNALSSEPEDDRCTRLTGVAGGLQVKQSHGCDVLAYVVQAHLASESLCFTSRLFCHYSLRVLPPMQIFFFFFGLVIIGIGVMTSSLEGSSFQIGNASPGDEGLPYRSAPACSSPDQERCSASRVICTRWFPEVAVLERTGLQPLPDHLLEAVACVTALCPQSCTNTAPPCR